MMQARLPNARMRPSPAIISSWLVSPTLAGMLLLLNTGSVDSFASNLPAHRADGACRGADEDFAVVKEVIRPNSPSARP